MTSVREGPEPSNVLRRRAEEALRGKPVKVDDLPAGDIQYLLHELQVHQAELSIQNEELRQVQLELEASRDLYADLYNFAPAGYCLLSQKDHILEANQTLAAMLGVQREGLIQKKLSQFVDREDQDEYYLYCKRAFADHRRQVGKIRLVKQAGEKIDVQLESIVAHEEEKRLRVMLSDITEQVRIEKVAQEAALLRELQHHDTIQREQERQQMARDLHDGPIQGLIAINFDLYGIIVDHPGPELAEQLLSLQIELKHQIEALRAYAGELRPPTLSKFGLEKTILSHSDKFQQKHPGIRIRLKMHQTGPLLPETTSLALFRIYQEALTNILKHVRGPDIQVLVRMEKDEHQVQFEIQDNGPGFDVPAQWIDLIREGHLGLMGMRERAEAVGGQLEIYSQKGEGTRVLVTVPLNSSAAE